MMFADFYVILDDFYMVSGFFYVIIEDPIEICVSKAEKYFLALAMTHLNLKEKHRIRHISLAVFFTI